MIVIRVIKDTDRIGCYRLAESRPCNNCILTMISFGIDKVYYSTQAGSIKCEKVQDMILSHVSRGFRTNAEDILKTMVS